MSNPYAHWYWSDYDSDIGLKVCSLAAQGLWMRMLCIAAQHEPPGTVALNGEDDLDAAKLARMIGAPLKVVKTALAELERNGVFSRDIDGKIYSRRLRSDAQLRAKSVANGKLGGNPLLLASRGKGSGSPSKRVNQADKAAVKARARDPIPIPKNPPYAPPNGAGHSGGLGRMNLPSGAFIDGDGVYRLSPEQRARFDAQQVQSDSPTPPPEEETPHEPD
jgi:hypothetical protein